MMWPFRKRPRTPETDTPPGTSSAGGSGDMAATLSAADLAADSRQLLSEIATRIADTSATTISDMAHTTRKTASDRMLRLVDEINRRISPHEFDKTPESTDASALVKSLQDQLKKRPAASIEDAANKQTGTTNNRDPFVQSDAPDVPLGGETKPEHATPEALINPFSLVNIQRGAAMGAVMTKDTTTNQNATSSTRSGQHQVERSTVSYKKKLLQPRFSRRRFLRDYRGTNLLTVIVLFLIVTGMNIGTIVTNVSVLIPQTVQNQRAGEESQTFLQKIDRDQPKLAALLKRRQKMNQDVEMVLRDFDTVSEIREDFANFITNLEDNPNVNLISQQINESGSELPDVSVVGVSLQIETSFLLWLRLRNSMVREVKEVNITDEVIVAPPGVPQINIEVTFSKPGRTK